MRELRIGESSMTGRAFNVTRKMVGEYKIQEFALGVSKKKKDGTYENGFFNVTLWGDVAVEDKTDIGLIGRIEPENYTKKDGQEVKTFRFNANEVFTPASWEKKATAPVNNSNDGWGKPAATGMASPVAVEAIDDSEIPF